MTGFRRRIALRDVCCGVRTSSSGSEEIPFGSVLDMAMAFFEFDWFLSSLQLGTFGVDDLPEGATKLALS